MELFSYEMEIEDENTAIIEPEDLATSIIANGSPGDLAEFTKQFLICLKLYEQDNPGTIENIKNHIGQNNSDFINKLLKGGI